MLHHAPAAVALIISINMHGRALAASGACQAHPRSRSRAWRPARAQKHASPAVNRQHRYGAAVDGGGRGGSSSGGGGSGGCGGGGGDDEPSQRSPLPASLVCLAAWAAISELWSVLQYRGMAARDAARRAELFPTGQQQQQQQRQQQSSAAPRVRPLRYSIIVPVLNEEEGLGDTLHYLQRSLDPPAHEIIVVDGGSTDATPAVAARCGVRVVRAGRGRARQMNAGAAMASGARGRESTTPVGRATVPSVQPLRQAAAPLLA